jgi:hypothetical protein
MGVLNWATIAQVRGFCACHLKEDGPRLRLVHTLSGDVLIDPRLDIRIDPEALALNLLSANLSDGKYEMTTETGA